MQKFIQDQYALADKIWLTRWHDAFARNDGLFHERIDTNNQTVDMGQIRLVTQTRQIFTYSVATDCSRRFGNTLEKAFATLQTKFGAPDTNGLYATTLTTDGRVKDNFFDFYAHAFVILSCVFYHRASGSVAARKQANQTLDRILDAFCVNETHGFYEALGPDLKPLARTRRQNPHMHLLEACLFGYAITGEGRYAEIAQRMVDLALNKFIKKNADNTCTLYEFFDPDLKNVHPTEGHKVEGGHHYEWIWLLDKARKQLNDTATLRDTQKGLYKWAQQFGHDHTYSGIYDTVDANTGNAILNTKRIWPITEAIKAITIAQRDGYATRPQINDIQKLWTHYLPDNGDWQETFNRDLETLALNERPASTPYHVINGLLESVSGL